MGNKILQEILDWEYKRVKERPDVNPYWWVNPYWDESFGTAIHRRKLLHGFPTDSEVSLQYLFFRKAQHLRGRDE